MTTDDREMTGVGSKQPSCNHDQRQSSRWQRRSDGSLSIELPRQHHPILCQTQICSIFKTSIVVFHQGKFLIPSHTETQSRREWGMYRRPFSPKLGVTGASQALPRPILTSFWRGDRSLKRRNTGWTGVLREGYRAGNLPVGWRGEGWGPTRQYQYPATSISANNDILQY